MGGNTSRPSSETGSWDDLLKDLVNAMSECQNTLASSSAPLDENGLPLKTYCKGEWDNLSCWPNSPPGTVTINCPSHIAEFNQDEYATRYCDTNGTWRHHPIAPKYAYSDCIPDGFGSKEDYQDKWQSMNYATPAVQRLVTLYTVGYSCTLVSLTFAMIILAYFPRLHCTRNYIHMHLFASFMLRAIIIFIKDKVLFVGSGILDMNLSKTDEFLDDLIGKAKDANNSYAIGCKIVMTLFHYFLSTNYFWVLVEALHLHSLIFITVFSEKKYIWKFILIGWGAPVLFVGSWAIVRATIGDSKCWDVSIPEYKWIYNGPIVIANVVNFLLFLNIIRVLWYKMREGSAISGAEDRRRYRYRKLAKSTLVLVFMFGVHAIVFIGVPDSINEGWLWDLRMYFDLFFNSFQGFFVAIIYCFCNGEVQTEFKRAWHRFNLSVEMQRGNRERSRSSVTGLTTFISSASQQARLSIAGQGRRGSNSHKINGQATNNNCTPPNANGIHPEYRTPLLQQNDQHHSTATDHTTLSMGEDERIANNKEEVNDPRLSKLDSEHDDIEEKAFEMAMQDNDSGRSANVDSTSESQKSSSGTDESDGKRCRRTPSFDSGISVMAGGHIRLSRGLSSNSESPAKESFSEDAV